VAASDAHTMMAIDELMELSQATAETAQQPGFKAVRAFIKEPSFLLAARAFDSLKALMPDGSTVASVVKHLQVDEDALIEALALLESFGAVEIADAGVRVAPKFFWEKPQ
jgi:hypothetical protein